ncbi:14239_t:CDS:1, partial [Funneliformis mosseae]
VIWVTAASRPPRKSSGISPPLMAETVDKSLSKFMHPVKGISAGGQHHNNLSIRS